MRSVPVRVREAHRRNACDPSSGKVRMRGINARINHRHRHVQTAQPAIVGIGHGIGGNTHPHPRQVVGRDALARRLHNLHAGQQRQRRPVRRRQHANHGPERRPIGGQHGAAELFDLRHRARGVIRKQAQRQGRAVRQRLLSHRGAQQRGIDLVIGLVREHRRGAGPPRHLRRARRGHPHQISVVRNVGNDLSPRGRQLRAEGGIQRGAGLYDVRA